MVMTSPEKTFDGKKDKISISKINEVNESGDDDNED